MTIYARLTPAGTFDALVDLTPEQYALMQANGKAALLRTYSVDAEPVPSASQRVDPGPYVSDATTTRKTWVLVNKTQEELDADAQRTEIALLKAQLTGLQTDITTGITAAPTTAAQAFVDIQDLKRMILRLNRIARWLLKNQ
jgi:hypothetical protein